jgi:tRNA U34 5-methylaminomethyl-2-thiouridine-forming methyltransferase MnmC
VDNSVATATTRRAPRQPDELARWLSTGPSLNELRRVFPAEWARVERDVARLVSGGGADGLRAYLVDAVRTPRRLAGRTPAAQVLVSDAVRR